MMEERAAPTSRRPSVDATEEVNIPQNSKLSMVTEERIAVSREPSPEMTGGMETTMVVDQSGAVEGIETTMVVDQSEAAKEPGESDDIAEP